MNLEERRLFGLRLPALRARAKCSQSEIAASINDAGINPGKERKQDFISKVERGDLLLSDEEIEAIVSALPQIAERHQRPWESRSEVSPFDLAFWEADPGDNSPSVLIRAAATYRAGLCLEQIDGRSEAFQAAQKRECYFLDVKYVDQFDSGLRRLRECVYGWLKETIGREPRRVSTGRFQPEYDAIRWTSLAAGERVVYPFPFILSPRRVFDWFVVPYGMHRRIGIALHESNPNWQDWNRLANRAPVVRSTPETNQWFGKLIADVRSEGGKAFGPEGWIQQELFQLLCGKVAGELELQTLPEFSKSLLSDQLHPKWSLPKERFHVDDIFVFDLANKDSVLEGIEKDASYQGLKVVEFPHGLDFPTGVGFTISMAPAVLPARYERRKDGQTALVHPWRRLEEILWSEIFIESSLDGLDQTYESAFSKIGIDLCHQKTVKPKQSIHERKSKTSTGQTR